MSSWMHRLPAAAVVPERGAYLTRYLHGKQVTHIGFCDANNDADDLAVGWLHAALAATGCDLVGLDISQDGVDRARAAGHAAHAVDCTDEARVAALELPRASVVLVSEVIEHVDNPGGLLRGAQHLCADAGELIVTTPNARSWLDTALALTNREISHPDHVALYSWFTLTNLLAQTGWRVERYVTYEVSPVTQRERSRRQQAAARLALAGLKAGNLVTRHFAPFAAGGLIAHCVRQT